MRKCSGEVIIISLLLKLGKFSIVGTFLWLAIASDCQFKVLCIQGQDEGKLEGKQAGAKRNPHFTKNCPHLANSHYGIKSELGLYHCRWELTMRTELLRSTYKPHLPRRTTSAVLTAGIFGCYPCNFFIQPELLSFTQGKLLGLPGIYSCTVQGFGLLKRNNHYGDQQ